MTSSAALRPRIGHGIDVHRFGEGDSVTLAGIRIAHTHGLMAHSDGDVALHALSDALLGALSLVPTAVSYYAKSWCSFMPVAMSWVTPTSPSWPSNRVCDHILMPCALSLRKTFRSRSIP